MVKRALNPEPKSSSNTTKKKQKKQQSLDSFFSVGKKKKASTSPTSVAESQGAKRKSSSIAESKAASTSATKCKHVKTPYTDGDGYPVITEPQQMFDDMVGGRLKKKDQRFLDMVKLTQHRPLRVATMCSGTESPLLALDMLQKSIQDACIEHSQLFDNAEPSSLFQLEHVFSCEIEPFKQAYIERNFSPKLLFRDIRELGKDHAHTAYGALQAVPNTPGDVDVLIAGTSCVDYSNLNNAKKKMEQQGESGNTFFGMMKFISKAQPPIVILENVCGAPWEKKVKLFAELEYSADFVRLDTKQFYIPHTRTRGYLFAVKKQPSRVKGMIKVDSRPKNWKVLVGEMKRPASADLDAFILPNNDPRVLRGRARLTAESSGDGSRAGRTDWTKCETRHLAARSLEELGDQRPFTGWSDSGSTVLPGDCWNEWANAQVNRIQDLMDINTLRLAADGVDACHKPMVWDLSQNVDRDTIGRLGLCQCLTPSGVHYLTTRGGPLCGEELLMMQGIPAEDLLFTKESEANLKDLAGNAMSTTVVGACTLAALVVGRGALSSRDTKTDAMEDVDESGKKVHNLVPRAMVPVTGEISVRPCFGEYDQRVVDLSPDRSLSDSAAWKAFLRDAASSARKCVSEGAEECIPVDQLVVCRECGHSSSRSNAFPPRKYCEHNFVSLAELSGPRVEPSVFRSKLLELVPMRVIMDCFDVDQLVPPNDLDPDLWKKWVNAFRRTVSDKESGDASEFLFEKLLRTQIWTASYRNLNGGRLEARVSKNGLTWLLFARVPAKGSSALKTCLENPMARMTVAPSPNGSVSLLHGVWRYCLPTTSKVVLSVEGIGDLVPSWRSRLGLKSSFEMERQYEMLRLTLKDHSSSIGDQDGLDRISGDWKLLPKCGGACGSLMKKVCASTDSLEDMFFFLDSGKKTLPNADAFVFADSCHRASIGEFRETILQIDPSVGFRPFLPNSGDDLDNKRPYKVELPVFVKTIWIAAENASLKPSRVNGCSDMHVALPVTPLAIPMHPGAWKVCPELLSCSVKVTPTEDMFITCQKNGGSAEINLHKSQKVLRDLSFATSRLTIPNLFDRGRWLSLESADSSLSSQAVCLKCSPRLPQIRWTLVSKAGKTKLIPIEDGREAAVFERAMKERPEPWIVRLAANNDIMPSLSLTIGCNAVSLVQRSLGLFPADSFVRECLVELAKACEIPRDQSMCEFDWRIVPHVEIVATNFPKLIFSSNRLDQEAEQPPNFSRYKLRKEQLRSLKWMLEQEATEVPFFEEEVTEAVLPSLNWRAEGRVRRPVLVRGGIVADEVGYGKTAITLGLIDASDANDKTTVQERNPSGLIPTKATLVVVPKHLLGQWPNEVTKFLGTSKTVIVIKDLSSLNKLSIRDVQNADIVLVCFSVLNNQKYFSRLARFSHVNPDSLPNGADSGRHFAAVYRECISSLPARVSEIIDDCCSAYASIEKAAASHDQQHSATSSVRLDGKKAVYKMGQSASEVSMSKTETKVKASERDPWRLSTPKAKFEGMKSPPLELFHWQRLVVDEFTYLAKKDRQRCLTVINDIKASFRWLLSGTPKHSNFNDISTLAGLLGVHLGVKEDLPGTKFSSKESTGLESLQNFLESRSMQWHMRRHALAQVFLDRMVRQNIAEIDEIPFEEHECLIDLSSAERAIYLELETHLNSLDMNSKSAQKSKRKSTGDREQRMQKVLMDSESAEEALMKCCSHFNLSSNSATASETVEEIIALRNSEQQKLVDEMVRWLTAALRQRQRILDQQPDWLSVTTTEKGEMCDALGVYLGQVEANASVPHGADEEVNKRVKEIVVQAKACFDADPRPAGSDPFFPEINLDDDESDSEVEPPSKKQKSDKKEDKFLSLFAMKQALRDHMHKTRSLSKELCGRSRSLRYIEYIHRFQKAKDGCECIKCDTSALPVNEVGVLSCCGHAGGLTDLRKAAEEGHCVVPLCTARVSSSHVLSANTFGRNGSETRGTGKFGRKLTALSKKVKQIVEEKGDRVIVFCQFDDLTEKVKAALSSVGIDSVGVKGTVTKQIDTIAVFQKEKPAKGDTMVLLLKMDDEQSAGLNLTNLNHAIFVHPLLADTQEEYDAYETQAIGRLRRYGQRKTVHVWRFLAKDTIDTTIFSQRSTRPIPTAALSD